MNKLIITISTILIGVIISLTGWLYIGLCDEDKRLNADKANNTAVMRTLDMMEKQRIEDREDDKIKDANQQKVNDKNDDKFQQMQILILKIVKEKK